MAPAKGFSSQPHPGPLPRRIDRAWCWALLGVLALVVLSVPAVAAAAGPHGGYSQNRDDCSVCHSPHDAAGPRITTTETVTSLCSSCHDSTSTPPPAGASYQGAQSFALSAHATVGSSTASPGAGSCGICHAVHGASKRAWDGSTPSGMLIAPQAESCTSGSCHSTPAASVGGVDILAQLSAGAGDSSAHDLLPSAQQATGARIDCSACHNAHRDSDTSKYSDPADRGAGMPGELARFTDGTGRVFAMVVAEHDGIAPVISTVTVDASAGATSPVIRWATDEPASTWVDWGKTTAYELGAFGSDSPLVTSHAATASVTETGTTVYHFRVRSADALGNTRLSPDRTYTATVIGTPTPISPVDTTVYWYTPPTSVPFSWSPVTVNAHAVSYDVVIRRGDGSTYKQLDRYVPPVPASPSWTDTNFPNVTDTFSWTVRAFDVTAGSAGPWSAPATFTADYFGDAALPSIRTDMFAAIPKVLGGTWSDTRGGIQVAAAEPAGGVVDFSVDTDGIVLRGLRRTAPSVDRTPAAAWQSAGSVSSTPTPTEPGTPASAGAVAAAAAVDRTYWSTGLATGDREWNRQVFRFDLGPRGLSAISELRLDWTGHGEPTPGYETSVYLWDYEAAVWVPVKTWNPLGTDSSAARHVSAVPDSFCLRCHSGTFPAGVSAGADPPKPIASGWTTATPSDFHGPRAGSGSSVSSGGLDAYSRGDAVACATCHDPHGSANPYHLPRYVNAVDTSDTAGANSPAAACATCHTGGTSAWHAGCISCHASLGPNHADPGVDFSSKADCLSCHGHSKPYIHACGASGCHPGGGSGPWTYGSTL